MSHFAFIKFHSCIVYTSLYFILKKHEEQKLLSDVFIFKQLLLYQDNTAIDLTLYEEFTTIYNMSTVHVCL